MPSNIRPYKNIHPRLGARVYVDPAATLIGDVELGDDVSLWPGSVVRGDVERIRIGARTNVQDGAVLHVTHDGPYSPGGFPCMVGAGALVAPGKVVGEAELWLGNPARCVRKLSDREIEQLHYSAAHYVRLKDVYRAAM